MKRRTKNCGKTLIRQREAAAEGKFEAADLSDIDDCDGWTPDGDFWSRRVYWSHPHGGDSTKGSYGVQFKPGTAEIVDEWDQ